MIHTVTRIFTFDSAHFLPGYEGKCADMHGHTYHLHVTVQGPIVLETGMIIDFGSLKSLVGMAVLDVADHKILNYAFPDTYPTAELLAQLFLERLRKWDKRVVSVALYETPTCFATATWQQSDDIIELALEVGEAVPERERLDYHSDTIAAAAVPADLSWTDLPLFVAVRLGEQRCRSKVI
jgi:6-pyruvoyltetrahydropterin/6-carboxytetrahydropterin synthase